MLLLGAIVAGGVLAGCGGVGVNPPSATGTHASATPVPSASPTLSPTPTPTPTATPTPPVIVASPSSLDFGGVNGSQSITVKETGFTGTFTATSADTTVVTVAPPSVNVSAAGNPASTGVFVVTSIGIGSNMSGTTTIRISDGTNVTTVPVTVSVTSGSITYVPVPTARRKS
jgi:hypothetical protein